MITLPVTSRDVYHNFALEYYLMTAHTFNEPVFMLWTTTPTVMLGKYQDAFSELDLNAVDADGLTVVRRYSGGGTIYTDEGGCQFTLIMPDQTNDLDFSQGLTLIQQALVAVGIHATTDSRNDLVVDGLKVSGSAQYDEPGYKLHHGSLLFDSDMATMASVLKVDPVKQKAKHIHSVHQRTINLKAQKPDWTAEQFRRGIIDAVISANNCRTVTLTAADEARISKIAAERFADPAVIYGDRQTFQMTRKRYVKGGGLVQIDYSLNDGHLSAVRLSGDFFSNLDTSQFSKALLGKPFDREIMKTVMARQLSETPILGITAEQLVEVLFDDKKAVEK